MSKPGAYWPQPWTCEDGGPRRWCVAEGISGLDLGSGEKLETVAVKDAFATDSLVRRDPGELFALRREMPWGGPQQGPAKGWVERLDPETLEVTATTGDLECGRYWPGGVAAHANGDLYAILGRWAYRMDTGLTVKARRELPVDRPYNSFVLLDSGELITKDCDAPAGLAQSTVEVLDPETLESLAPSLPLPEPSIARLAGDGETVIAIGTTKVFRIRFDRDAGTLTLDDEWRPSYGPEPERSFGWDPVITPEHVFWMDQGQNHVDRSMLGSGDRADPVRLWWSRLDDGTTRSLAISGLPYGTESNPPAYDPVEELVIAYDAGNAVVGGWKLAGDELLPQWRRDGLAHAGHLILFPDTRELVVQDFRDLSFLRRKPVRRALRPSIDLLGKSSFVRRNSGFLGSDQVVVLDLDTGEEKARASVPSPSQAFLFPAPGFERDLYYQSISTIARVAVT